MHDCSSVLTWWRVIELVHCWPILLHAVDKLVAVDHVGITIS